MKLFLTKSEGKEIEITVKYPEMNADVKRLVEKIKSCDHNICGEDNGRQYMIKICDIYYIECVDRKTFIYTKNQVFSTEQKLYRFAEELKDYDFVQVSKTCILNLDVLQYIKTLYNSRMEATLINEEKVTVSRTYVSSIKKALSKEGI